MTQPSSIKADIPVGRANADLSNWRQQPHSHWAFQHVDELIATDLVKADSSTSSALPANLQPLDQIVIPVGSGVSLAMRDFLARTDTDGLVILHKGKLVYEFYDHGMTRESRHIIMSATKSVVGLLAGILSANGTLDLNAQVSSLVPEISDTAYQGATLRDLIDMRTGINLDASDFAAYAAAAGWQPVPEQEPLPGLHAFFSTMHAPLLPHGGSFSYISANIDLLGWAIERASGEKFATLLSQLLWQPLLAEKDAFITLDRHGAARCTGGLCTTLLDLARVGQLVVDSGRVGDQQIVAKAWLDDIVSMGDMAAWDSGEFASAFAPLKMSYRSGWYVIEQAPKMQFAMGIHGQNLFVDAHNQLVIAKLSSQQLPIDPVASGMTLRAVMTIRHWLAQQTS
jgi:CubicO group peptidase (beta-lactamase class C family)